MKKWTGNKKGFATVGTALALLMSLPFVSSALMNMQTQGRIYEAVEAVPATSFANDVAGLVLGAAAYPIGLSAVLKDRMDTAIELYGAKKVNRLILSGAPNEVKGMLVYALKNGVAETDIVQDPNGLNTLASIRHAQSAADMIIVSQRYHLPRAVFAARQQGINAVGVVADKQHYPKLFDFKKRELLATSKMMMDLFL